MTRTRAFLAVLAALVALNAVLLLAQPSLALTTTIRSFLFGPNLVRAEAVVLIDGQVRVYRADVGRITAARAGTLRLLERDGTVVTMQVAPGAQITVNGQPARFADLRRGMRAFTARNGDRGVEIVEAFGRRRG